MSGRFPAGLEVFSTAPPFAVRGRPGGITDIVRAAQWSEAAGCTGILVYADNSQLDPWMVAQLIVQHTTLLYPLVAVQPVYMHPYSVAKIIASLAQISGRRVFLNMVAGGFTRDLSALDDRTPHDRRYDRLVEHATIVQRLLGSSDPLSFDGEFYKTSNLKLTPPLPRDLLPGVFVSGSSDAGRAAALALRATAIKYPQTASKERLDDTSRDLPLGLRLGIIARPTDEEAWTAALQRFPDDRLGELLHQLALKVSDSHWYRQLSGSDAGDDDSTYWLTPFERYQTMCPYLVGSYGRVGRDLGRYLDLGYRTFILDVPVEDTDLAHTSVAFDQVCSAIRS